MLFWIRELAGWFLVLCSLYGFLKCLEMLENRQPAGAGILAVIGIIVFRGGIHLIKVATAARVVTSAKRKKDESGGRKDKELLQPIDH